MESVYRKIIPSVWFCHKEEQPNGRLKKIIEGAKEARTPKGTSSQ